MKTTVLKAYEIWAILDGATQIRRANNPLGEIGDKLTVLEDWCIDRRQRIIYKADALRKSVGANVNLPHDPGRNIKTEADLYDEWNSADTMNPEFSRFIIKVLDVWREPVQDIQSDAIIEEAVLPNAKDLTEVDLIKHYQKFWNENNPESPWESFPWFVPNKIEIITVDRSSQ